MQGTEGWASYIEWLKMVRLSIFRCWLGSRKGLEEDYGFILIHVLWRLGELKIETAKCCHLEHSLSHFLYVCDRYFGFANFQVYSLKMVLRSEVFNKLFSILIAAHYRPAFETLTISLFQISPHTQT